MDINATPDEKRSSGDKWSEFLAFCNEHALANLWFRGVCDKGHRLIPKVGRKYEAADWNAPISSHRNTTPAAMERRILGAFERRARLGLQFIPTTEFEWLALAQHHGVPTRLLDWTTNPLMAAWFATDCPNPSDNQIARVYVASVSPKLIIEGKKLDPFAKREAPIFVVSPHWHTRVRAQRGRFSVHPRPNEPWQPKTQRALQHFDIERAHWREFRRRLFYFGIDASTVMADLGGLGEALSWQYANDIGIGEVGY